MSQKRGFCRLYCPWNCWFRAGLGHEHLSPLTRLMVYPYVLDSLVSFGSCFRFWCGTEEGLCYTAFSPLLLGLQRAVMLQAWVLLLSLCLCFAHAAFAFCLQDKQTLQKTATKIHVFTSLQIRLWRDLGWGRMGGCCPQVSLCVLTLAGVICTYADYKGFSCFSIKGLSKRQKLHPDQ